MEKMTLEEFAKIVIEKIKDFLPDRYVDSDVRLQDITKNNDTKLKAVTITVPNSNISPTIYLNSMYEQYQRGKPMEEILNQIAAIQAEHDKDIAVDVSAITDYEKVQGKVAARLVNAENNQELLSQRPHILVGDDLAVTYCIMLGESDNGSMSVPITNQLMENYGVTVGELHEAATQNMDELTPASFKSMNEVMAEMMLPSIIAECGGDREQAEQMLEAIMPPMEDGKMYVLTNEQKTNGAAVILNDKVMDQISEKVGGEFYILPSSVHELLIVPRDAGMEVPELEKMVCEVNATQVSVEERLSDHVYAYDAQTHEIYRADMEQEHMVRKEIKAEKTPKARESVKDKLASKQKEVANTKRETIAPAVKKDKTAAIE